MATPEPTDPVGTVIGALPNGELLVLDEQCPVTSRRCARACADRCSIPIPTDADLAYLLEEGCTDLLHAARCFALLHSGPRARVNLYRDEKLAAIAATREEPAR